MSDRCQLEIESIDYDNNYQFQLSEIIIARTLYLVRTIVRLLRLLEMPDSDRSGGIGLMRTETHTSNNKNKNKIENNKENDPHRGTELSNRAEK